MPLVKRPIKLREMCNEGYWYCTRCEQVLNLSLDLNSPARCPHCKKPCAEWMKPAFQDLQTTN